jgi:hypothetical protein
MLIYERKNYWLLILCSLGILLLGIASDGLMPSLQGFIKLQTHAARLINDFTIIGGVGGALFNAGIMGFLSLILIKLCGVTLSGPTLAAYFTIVGFSLFGKTPLNAFPVVLGVYFASKVSGKSFSSYVLFALFGTALGPLVSYILFEAGFTGFYAIPLGIVCGVIAGFVLPGIGMAMLRMHEGFNLYNIGLTCGFLALFFASFLVGAKQDINIKVIWNTEPHWGLILLTPALSILLIIWGAVMDGRKLFTNLKRIMSLSGRLPSDFMFSVSPGAALVNAGILGLVGTIYMLLIKAPLNGPVIGGLFTVIGFATFGKHLKNCWPVALGVIIATLLYGKALNAPGPVLAFLFVTTLAPLSGEFGPLIGIAAGFVHLSIVERSAAWHGGLDLYNNGFAGGLTATLFLAIIQWFKGTKKK